MAKTMNTLTIAGITGLPHDYILKEYFEICESEGDADEPKYLDNDGNPIGELLSDEYGGYELPEMVYLNILCSNDTYYFEKLIDDYLAYKKDAEIKVKTIPNFNNPLVDEPYIRMSTTEVQNPTIKAIIDEPDNF